MRINVSRPVGSLKKCQNVIVNKGYISTLYRHLLYILNDLPVNYIYNNNNNK